MRALLITAHGSRRSESNTEIIALAKDIANISSDRFDWVRCAFIQFASPLFRTQVDDLVENGVNEIIIFPYFIAAGSHVLKDIPELIEKAKNQYPHVTFKLTPHLGRLEGIQQLILNEVHGNACQ
jgi:sirohydrochlorin ferrochelatase